MRSAWISSVAWLAAIVVLGVSSPAVAFEVVLDDGAEAERAPNDDTPDWTLRVRLSPPLTNVEILDDQMGTTAVLAGSAELDFMGWFGVEAGGSWLHTDSLDDPAWDVFVRAIGLLPLHEGRDWTAGGEGWVFEAVGAAGYRFLHEVEELDALSGSLDMHALTVGAGARATWWWAEPRVGLEFRLLPMVSVALAESTDGAWGVVPETDDEQPDPSNPVVIPQQPTFGGGGGTPFFGGGGTGAPVGNPDETDWGLDFEITVGIAF